MRRTIVSIVAGVLASASGIGGQGAPKPGPEHKRLEYFVGKWTTVGEMKPSPFGPAGKFTASDACEWFQGGFAIVCQSDGKGPAGAMKSIGIMGYSADQKVYTYYGLDNTAMTMMAAAKGTIQGDTWTFTDSGTMGGQPYQSRFILKTGGPSSYTFRWEGLGKDKKWMPIVEGTSTRAR